MRGWSRPIYWVFFMNAAVLGNWIPRIPDVKTGLGLSDTELGLCLLVIAAGTLIVFSAGAPLVQEAGLRKSCLFSMPAWALAFVGVGATSSVAVLVAALLAAGLGVGFLELAMNAKADDIEQADGVRIMSRCHGFWSLGSLFGALLGSGLASAGLGVAAHFALIMPLLAIAGMAACLALSHDRPAEQAEDEPRKANFFVLPSRELLPVCLMPIGIMLVEGAFIDWSALFVREQLAGGPLAIGMIYAAFSAIMATTRLSGDRLIELFGTSAVAQASSIAATCGIALFALSPSIPWAFAGAALSGLGVAILYPIAVTAAARHPSGKSTANVAALSLTAFTAFMLAPPVIGFLSDIFSLRIALACLVPLAGLSLVLSRRVLATPGRRRPGG